MTQQAQTGQPAAAEDRSHVGLGIFCILFGLGAGWLAWGYGTGTVSEMGPGFFPLVMSGLLGALGLVVLLRRGGDVEPLPAEVADSRGELGHKARVLGAVLGGIFLFALTVEPLGLFLSVILLTVVCSLGHPGPRVMPVAALALGLAIGSVLIFVVALKLQLHTWPDLG